MRKTRRLTVTLLCSILVLATIALEGEGKPNDCQRVGMRWKTLCASDGSNAVKSKRAEEAAIRRYFRKQLLRELSNDLSEVLKPERDASESTAEDTRTADSFDNLLALLDIDEIGTKKD